MLDQARDGNGMKPLPIRPGLRPLPLRLGRRFMRSASLAASTWLMAAVSATVVASFIALSALALSDEQVAERDLGRFAYSSNLTNVATITPGKASLVREIESAARAGGAIGPMAALTSNSVEPAQPDPPTTWYTEADWVRNPFPRRYSLLDGRWPERAGEVVLVRTMAGTLAPLGGRLNVLAGHEQFAVVGVSDDRYGDYHAILAAPGTFAGIGEAALRSFPELSAYPTLYWEGGGREGVTDALSVGLARALGRPRGEVAQVVGEFTQDRAQAPSAESRPWIDRIPSGYAVPSLLLPILAALATFGLGGRRLQRSAELLVATGVRPGSAALALGAAAAGWLAISLAVGVGVGSAIGAIGRLAIDLSPLWRQPLSPFPGLADPVARMGLSTVVACVVGTVMLRFALAGGRRDRASSADGAERNERGYRRHMTHIRHGVAVLAACAAIWQVSRLDPGTVEPMLLATTIAVTVLLLAPEVFGRALHALPKTEPRLRLVRKQFVHDRARGAITVAALAAVLGLPLGYLVLFEAMIRTGESGLAPEVVPGQVLVSGIGGSLTPPPPTVLAVVSDRLGKDHPSVRLRYLGELDALIEMQGSGPGVVLALDTADDIGRLLARPLTSAERAALADSGLLVWDGREGGERVLVSSAEGVGEVRLPSATARVHPAWQSGNDGVVLSATAERAGLPVSDGGVVFTGVSDADARQARQAILDAGLDPYQVRIYELPKLYVPEALFVAAAGLLLIVLLCSIAVSRAQVRTLRRYLGTLVAIGLSPSWARQVVLVQSAFLAAVATIVALALAIAPVVITAWRLEGFVLSIPWRVVGLVVVTFYVAVLLAALLSCRQIRASDRAAL